MNTQNNRNQLVCPHCKTKLTSKKDILVCLTCNTSYPIKNSIPDFLDKDLQKSIEEENNYWNENIKIDDNNLYENLKNEDFFKLLNFFNLRKNTIGLELGCGDGPFSRRLDNQNYQLYGVDISLHLLQHTKNLYPIRASALQLPFKTFFFDWIIYAFSLHHMVDIKKAIKEASRILKPHGLIYIVEPNYYHPIRFITRRPKTFIRKYFFKYLTPSEKWTSSKQIKKILKNNNIKVIQIQYLTFQFQHSSFFGKFQLAISKFLNFLPIKKFIHSYVLIIGEKQ